MNINMLQPATSYEGKRLSPQEVIKQLPEFYMANEGEILAEFVLVFKHPLLQTQTYTIYDSLDQRLVFIENGS